MSKRKKRKRIAPEEANKMLPLISPITQEIVTLWQEVLEKVEVLKGMEEHFVMKDDTAAVDEQELLKTLEEVREQLETLKGDVNGLTEKMGKGLNELEELGCIAESYEQGVIDFPSAINGKDVLLCWKLGEEKIEYYHQYGESCADRKLLDYEYPDKEKRGGEKTE
jgi:hypothetical protein